MADITAALVNELRSKTGQGMMECKKMLTLTGGDITEAIKKFREKGVKASLTERAASEGRVVELISADGHHGAIVEVNCNTDFTAKSEPVLKLATDAAGLLLKSPGTDVSTTAETVAAANAVAQTTGENVRIGRTAHLENATGKVGGYVYAITGKIAVLMSVSGKLENATTEFFTQLGGHIAYSKPLGLTRETVPAELVAKERDFAVEQAKATGKPQQIAEKIAEGKLNSFFAERVLLDQEFFNAQVHKGTIAKMVQEKGLKLDAYARIEVGQG
jgi:elongation factor Ts